MKQCSKCRKTKDLAAFPKSGEGVYAYCKPCHAIRARVAKSKKANAKPGHCPEGHVLAELGVYASGACRACALTRSLKLKYGLTPDDVQRLYDIQMGQCAICRKPLGTSMILRKDLDRQSKTYRMEIDHDHKIKDKRSAVRGLLCGGMYAGCNILLAKIDREAWLSAAIEYVRNPPARGQL